MQLGKILHTSLPFLVTLVVVSGCDHSAAPTSSPDPTAVPIAYDALESALSDCARAADACVQDAGDDAAQQVCRDQLAGCRESAARTHTNTLAGAIAACIDVARQCTKNTRDSGTRGVCRDELKACLGDDGARGDEDGGDDASHSKVGDCVVQMRTCVLDGGSAENCADAMRACVLAATPGPNALGQGRDHGADAGMPGVRQEPPRDAGTGSGGAPARTDAGPTGAVHAPPVDAGMPSTAGGGSCQQQFDACKSAGGSQPACNRVLHKCNKPAPH